MKCKINGFWNSNGTGKNDQGNAFSWNNFFFSITYADKRQQNMIGEKSNTIKVRASDLNQMLGMGLTPDGIVNLTAKEFEAAYSILGSTCLIDYDDDKNIVDFEILTPGSGNKIASSVHAGANVQSNKS